MLVRIILLFLLFKYHRKIYHFLVKNNFLSLGGIIEKLQGTMETATKMITTNELKKQLLILKTLDIGVYQEVKKRIKNIEKIYQIIQDEKDINLKNNYQNMKDEKRKIKNSISSMVVNKGLNRETPKILEVIEKYLDTLIQNVLEIRDKRGINTDWFEGTLYEPVLSYDPQLHQNYDFFN